MQTQDAAVEIPDYNRLSFRNPPVQEPVNPETTDTVEEPTLNNEPEPAETEEVEEAAPVEQQNAGRTIQALGNDRKALLKSLIDQAHTPSGKEALLNVMEGNPSIEREFKTKFPEDYDAFVTGRPKPEIDTEAIKAAAKADAILEHAKRLEDKQLELYAESKKFTADEFEKFKSFHEALRPIHEGDDESLLEKAAILVAPNKLKTNTFNSVPKSTEEKPSPKPQASNALRQLAERHGVDPARLADLKGRVSSNDNGTGLKMTLS